MTPPDDSIPTDRAELEQDIEQTRAQLADTVEALAHKADVKAQVQEKTAGLKEQAKATAGQVSHTAHEFGGSAKQAAQRPANQQAAAAGIAALVVLLVWFLRRRRR